MVKKFILNFNQLIVGFLIIFLSGCATLPEVDSTKKEYLNLKDLCEGNRIDCQIESLSGVITLNKDNITSKALVSSNIAIVEGDKIVLSSPVRMVDSEILVPLDYKTKVIGRLAAPEKTGKQKKIIVSKEIKKIIIDPGHGGKDPGAISKTGIQEKELNLDISKRLKNILEKEGFEVIMTRNRDVFISLEERTEIASRSMAELFVSVHANSSPSKKLAGMEFFCLKNLEYFEKNEEQRKTNHNLMFNKFLMKKNDKDLKKIISDMLYTRKQAESPQLAYSIGNSLTRNTKAKNLGIKQSRFFVLRNTLIPAVLVEVGFMSNFKEEKLLKTSEYRQKIAEGIADGIMDYLGK